MTAGAHFGCPKFTFDRISGHFRSIRNFDFFGNFWQNGCRRPFWMSEIHFRSHFWPLQIDTQLYFFWKFLTKWLPSAILDARNTLSIAFLAILDQSGIVIFLGNFWQNGCHRPFWMSEIHISGHLRSIWNFYIFFNFFFWPFQIDRPFWMSEIHFR